MEINATDYQVQPVSVDDNYSVKVFDVETTLNKISEREKKESEALAKKEALAASNNTQSTFTNTQPVSVDDNYSVKVFDVETTLNKISEREKKESEALAATTVYQQPTGFMYQDANGNITVSPVSFNGTNIRNNIINSISNHPVIKELGLKVKDVSFYMYDANIIAVTVVHSDGTEEAYRFDLINNIFYVQIPLVYNYTDHIENKIYKFVAVPIDSPEAKEALTNNQYTLDNQIINFDNLKYMLFRETSNEGIVQTTVA